MNEEITSQKEEQPLIEKDVKYFSFNLMVYLNAYMTIFTLIGCYSISQSNFAYVKIFPRQFITLTGRHYPQAILFRYGLGATSLLLGFFFYIVFLWIQKQARRINYKGPICRFLYYPIQFAFFCEFITVGTIDVGQTWLPHRLSAYTFYFITFPILGLVAIIIHKMRKKSKTFMNSFNHWTKVYMALFLLFLNAYSLISCFYLPVKIKVVIAINEWAALYILIFWFFSFTEDWKGLKVSFSTENMEFSIIEEEVALKKEKKIQSETQEEILNE